jgi:hypothetical protein
MRRIFRRHIRKTLAQDVPPVLQEANFAFEKGEYGRAGELFERIAQTAADRGVPRAALFYLQAGHARILAGQTSLGMPSVRRAFNLLSQQRRPLRFHRIARRVIAEMTKRGLDKEVAELEGWLKDESPEALSVEEPSQRPTLPNHCPSCGAAVRPDEIEWLDELTVECAYCGSPIREQR